MVAQRFTDDEAEALAQAYASGESLKSLGEKHGTTPMTIKNTLLRVGKYQPRSRGGQWRSIDDIMADTMVVLYESGQSLAAIARALGTHSLTVARVLGERGIDTAERGRKGPGHPAFKGGRHVDGNGYVLVRIYPDDPFYEMTTRVGTVLEHRLVMARSLGRPLVAGETVHHIDGDRANNALSNLQLRQGQHGKGVVMACLDCGSHRVAPVPLA